MKRPGHGTWRNGLEIVEIQIGRLNINDLKIHRNDLSDILKFPNPRE